MIKRLIATVGIFALALVTANAAVSPEDIKGVTIKETVWESQEYERGYFSGFSEGLAILWKDGKSGYIDKMGKLVIPAVYDKAEYFDGGLAWVKQNGKWGCIDKTGEVVIPLIYSAGDPYAYCRFIGDYAIVKNGKWGMIDRTGKKIVRYIYDGLDYFSEGLAAAQIDGKWGYIDADGNEVIAFVYDRAYSFSEGLGLVQKDGKYGFIDITGEIIIPFIYNEAYYFHHGLAAMKKDGKWGFIDKTGGEVLPFIYDDIHGDVSEDVMFARRNGKMFLIDRKTGREIEHFEYDDSSYYFTEGLAWVGNDTTPPDTDPDTILYRAYKYGFVDKTGKEVIPLIYDIVDFGGGGAFRGGMAAVGEYSAWRGGIIGGPEYKYGYIDKTGKLIVPYIYDSASGFSEGFAIVGNGSRDTMFDIMTNYKYGVIDKMGKEVIPLVYDDISDFNSDGFAIAQKDGKYSILEIVKPPNGAILGNVLNSDVKTYINDERIPCYNIKNKAVVLVADLKNYGFDVVYNNKTRTSTVTRNKDKKFTPIKNIENNMKKPGSVAFSYVYTDIIAVVNGKIVESYNVQGNLAIYFESLGDYGTFQWDNATKTSKLTLY